MDATYGFRIGLSSGRPVREDREVFVSVLGEDSHAGMLQAQQLAVGMACGFVECAMPVSSELVSVEL